MKIGALIVARLGSSRLKAKNLMKILDKPMIQHLAERIQRAGRQNLVAIATSTDVSDNPLEDFAQTIGIQCYRGSLENVMERVAGAGSHFNCDAVVEILGDNPLVHSDLIDDVIDLFVTQNLDYAANITKEYGTVNPDLVRFPIGVRVQVYKTSVAHDWKKYPEFLAKDLGTSAYIFHHPETYKCGYLEATGSWKSLHQPSWHFAVNYQKNFDLIEKIFAELYPKNHNFSLQDVMMLMRQRPEWHALMGG